jgi:hypothetical protein
LHSRSAALDPSAVVPLCSQKVGPCPLCMDRLLFATEGVLSEVADMYPAC